MRFPIFVFVFFLLVVAGVVSLWVWFFSSRPQEKRPEEAVAPVLLPPGKFSVAERLEQIRDLVEPRVQEYFLRKDLPFPPERIALLGFKQEKRLEVYALDQDGEWVFVHAYPILGASGTLGPKLREGDLQVPEGIYAIESLNPNSRYHLSLRINYPNAADRLRAIHDGRENEDPGGDIMIHGNSVSIGCLAVGDVAAEELFFLAASSQYQDWEVLLSPWDFRKKQNPSRTAPEDPIWVSDLYDEIEDTLQRFPLSPSP